MNPAVPNHLTLCLLALISVLGVTIREREESQLLFRDVRRAFQGAKRFVCGCVTRAVGTRPRTAGQHFRTSLHALVISFA